MEIQISQKIKQLVNDFQLGVVHYQNIQVSESPQMLKGRLRLFQESLYFDYADKKITEVPAINEWRKLFKTIGTDPSRYRPSSEALYRRVQKQQYLDYVNSAVDLNNFLSLQYQIPLGIYDVKQIKGNVSIEIGTDQATYLAINGRDVSMAKKLVSVDEDGPFGSPYVDSKRTAVSTSTTDALHLVYLQPSQAKEDAAQLLQALAKMFTQIHGGEATFDIY
ncbi:B3/B4 domain-containing protein [Metabacillus niabensis]|uniref:DNA/RNA-binding domain of Phe-tRNA-synthetase-like protein n=1 Tax=Metabacillus niabensis TaxID=324854 RepID=A0ABT9YXL0_9BACI|nr:phenylalanine--tRNA ligase beta subunit-related protein [Metabacillus niabensis]MDQ0224362.1 DNA/RNA-binding domain of Phe-tRNA-synthetase-like protein [Metabacillus niabensis]